VRTGRQKLSRLSVAPVAGRLHVTSGTVKARSLLQAITFGEDVADFDEQLATYFVETSSFNDVVSDRVNLVLGEKGSGKSAIFRQLADEDADISQLIDVDIVPAFNPQGSVIFRRLADYPDLPEETLRFAWFSFFVALASNHVINAYGSVGDVKKLAKLLRKADFQVGSASPAGVWARIDAMMEALSQRMEVEGEVGISSNKLPIQAKTKGKLLGLRRRDKRVDVEEILSACVDVLESLDRRCWIVLDRLDEAFQQDEGLERRALRALLRAYLDLSAYETSIKAKLFLRSDLLDRVSKEQGFVNATHLRSQRLSWDREGILDLIARRIYSNAAFRDHFNFTDADVRSRAGRKKICYAILPKVVDRLSLISWVEEATSDGTGARNPRNVISLLRLARSAQLEHYDRADPELLPADTLIGRASLRAAHERLSRDRMEDTVLAEYPELRPAVDILRRKPARFNRTQLADFFAMHAESKELDELVGKMTYVGLLTQLSPSRFQVPLLYRPALESRAGRGTAGRLSYEEALEIASRVDEACIEAEATGRLVVLADLDEGQTAAAKDQVVGNFPNLRYAEHHEGLGYQHGQLVIYPADEFLPGKIGTDKDADADRRDDVDAAALTALVRTCHERVLSADGGGLVVSDALSENERFEALRISRDDQAKDGIGVVAYIDAGNRYQLVFAQDVPASSITEQERLFESQDVEHEDILISYMNALCDLAEQVGRDVYVRPMGPRMMIRAAVIVAARPDLESTVPNPQWNRARLVIRRKDGVVPEN
jgi:hypothetical protein